MPRLIVLKIIGLLALCGFVACKKQVGTQRASDPPVLTGPTDREIGDRHRSRGEYRRAVESYERYLSLRPEAEDRGSTLLSLAVLYALPDGEVYDPVRAADLLRELGGDPTDPKAIQAKLILVLQQRVRELETDRWQLRDENHQLMTALEELSAIESRKEELHRADRKLAEGDYEEAAHLYRKYLENDPVGFEAGHARLHLAICYAHPGSGEYDPARAEGILRGLLEDPSHSADASLILELTRQMKVLRLRSAEDSEEIDRLSRELERLKEIDLKSRHEQEPD